MTDFKFPKSERLTNKKKFEKLFESGQTIKAFPLKIVYILEEETEGSPKTQFAFTVPKRSFKKAVDRNYIKRRMKEAFRLHKHEIPENIDLEKKNLYGIFIYINRGKQEFHAIEKAMVKGLSKLFKAQEKT